MCSLPGASSSVQCFSGHTGPPNAVPPSLELETTMPGVLLRRHFFPGLGEEKGIWVHATPQPGARCYPFGQNNETEAWGG